jgi:hypothetical protein
MLDFKLHLREGTTPVYLVALWLKPGTACFRFLTKMNQEILLVDDEPNLLDGLKRMLGNEFSVTTADGGGERASSIC